VRFQGGDRGEFVMIGESVFVWKSQLLNRMIFFMGAIWSIILAAGESKRMGFPKMLLPINGKPMIENVILNVEESVSDGILVVLGASCEKIVDLVSKYDVRHCYNENYKEGMLSSVQCGFRNLQPDIDAVLVFQGDQPFIAPAVINSVISAYRESGKGIVIPVFKGKRGHPLLLGMKYREAVDTIDPGEGLRSVARLYRDDVLEVETADQGILRDFDTYDDYMKELNQTL
jgi:molybdenum cofactor cytidylyltransferase